MNLKDVFNKIGHGLKAGLVDVGHALGILENNAAKIEEFAQEAVPIIQMIAGLAPNRAIHELEALAEKFALHAPQAGSDPIQVESFLQDCAVKELQKAAPGVPNSYLRSAISLAFHFVKPKDVAAPVTAGT